MNRINKSATRLFEVWCEVEPTKSVSGPSGKVVRCFPDTFNDEKVLNDIGEFAFPCDFEKNQVQVYSFVLTDTNSQWRFGFCRHDTKSDNAMLVVTHLPWHEQFVKYINVLAEIRSNSPKDFQRFLSETYALGLPEPGSSVKVFSNHDRYKFEFKCPWSHQLPSIPESHNLNVYYNFVEPEMMINIFCAMLNERRIIFTSQQLNVLSSCVLAAGDLIYPMTWQHIYIPVLPMKMKEYVNAPMPYLIGVAQSVLTSIRPEELADVVIFDCDKQTFISPFDDKKVLPKEILEFLKKNLNNTKTGDNVSRAFLRAIVQLIGGYRDGLKFGEVITFDDQRFLEARSPKLRPFLTKILDLQIFRQFIDERLTSIKDGFSDEFEKEICLYSERVSKRKFKILHNIKEKTNPALNSAVQSARESGRNVKSVYKVASKAVKTKIKNARHNKGQPNNVMTTSGVEIQRTQSERSSPDFSRRRHSQDSNIGSSFSSSPSHSYSSSDMNILAELELEGLFEKPEANRNLKPKNTHNASNFKTYTALPIPPMRKNNLPSLVPPPPRPPRTTSNQTSLNNTQPNKSNIPTILSQPKLVPNQAITLPPKEYDPFQHPDIPPNQKAPMPLVPPRKNHVQVKSQADVFNNSYEQWAIKTRPDKIQKTNEVNKKQQETKNAEADPVRDLITLQDSLELEDFDPLNDNAKNLPQPLISPASSTSITSSNVIGFSNPNYTFNNGSNDLSPYNGYLNTPAAPNSLELLRDYGLFDQYSRLANGHVDPRQISSVATTAGDVSQRKSVNNNPKQDWMTFD